MILKDNIDLILMNFQFDISVYHVSFEQSFISF
jgi:hypothetical protein